MKNQFVHSVYNVITLHFLAIPRADTEQVSVAEWVRDTDTLQQITSTFFFSLRSHCQKNANHLKQHSFFLHHN